MSKKIRADKLYIEDILTSIDRITQYIDEYDFAKFNSDIKTIDAVIRNFEIIGEAAKKISPEVKNKYSDIPWAEMYYLRNRITHDYFNVDIEIIWEVAVNYLPQNKVQITELFDKEFKKEK